MPRASNKKGGEFERMVCRCLTWWITGKERPEIFWRSATSGAKATQEMKRGHKTKQGGDIIAIDPKGQWFIDLFSVECKDRKDFGNLDLVLERQGVWIQWWDQCCDDADKVGKHPLLIFHRKLRPVMIAHLASPYMGDFGPPWHMKLTLSYKHVVVVSPFEEWLAHNTPEKTRHSFGVTR